MWGMIVRGIEFANNKQFTALKNAFQLKRRLDWIASLICVVRSQRMLHLCRFFELLFGATERPCKIWIAELFWSIHHWSVFLLITDRYVRQLSIISNLSIGHNGQLKMNRSRRFGCSPVGPPIFPTKLLANGREEFVQNLSELGRWHTVIYQRRFVFIYGTEWCSTEDCLFPCCTNSIQLSFNQHRQMFWGRNLPWKFGTRRKEWLDAGNKGTATGFSYI